MLLLYLYVSLYWFSAVSSLPPGQIPILRIATGLFKITLCAVVKVQSVSVPSLSFRIDLVQSRSVLIFMSPENDTDPKRSTQHSSGLTLCVFSVTHSLSVYSRAFALFCYGLCFRFLSAFRPIDLRFSSGISAFACSLERR